MIFKLMAPLQYSVDSIMNINKRGTIMPWNHVKEWNPFKIDALGLVTLLGADEVNQSIGTLHRRNFTEYLPLLAAFVIASDNFTKVQAGFALYNISDGIFTTELKGWFTRWLMSHEVRNGTTVFRFKIVPGANNFGAMTMIAPLLSFIAVAPLLGCTVVIGDWYGVGNSLAIIFSIFVRLYLLWQRRTAIERMAAPRPLHHAARVIEEHRMSFSDEKAASCRPAAEFYDEYRDVDSIIDLADKKNLTNKKIFVTRQDGKMVTIYTPQTVLGTFTREARLINSKAYSFAQAIGWTAFGAHICVLGMSTLFTQIYTVVLLVFSTWMLVHGFSSDLGRTLKVAPVVDAKTGEVTESEIISIPFGQHIIVEQINPPTEENMDRRMWGYLRADPSPEQERMLQHWSLLPFESNVRWYQEYYGIRKGLGHTIPVNSPVDEAIAKKIADKEAAKTHTPGMTVQPKAVS